MFVSLPPPRGFSRSSLLKVSGYGWRSRDPDAVVPYVFRFFS